MANVLPQKEKKRILREVRSRFILTLALVLLVGALVASASMLPAWISVRIALNGISHDSEMSQTVREDQAKHARALALVNVLNPLLLSTTTPSGGLIAALTAKPAGMSITGINYTKGQLVLTGVSRDRQALNEYRETLEDEALFTSVNVPVAALVGTQDGRFTITLLGQF
jgi:Tfp pilus assembly protein PilN